MLPAVWAMLASLPELSQEQLNKAEDEAKELKARLEAQGEGNSALKADYDAEVAKSTMLQGKVDELTSQIAQKAADEQALQAKVTEMQAELDGYKELLEEKQQAGKGLPGEDSNSRDDAAGIADYNADAIAVWKKRKSGK